MRKLVFLLLFAQSCLAQTTETLKTAGLQQPVEIIRDRWGINHIYAKNEHDLFFAQGYSAAQDRLFQLDLWRRQATGTVAELLGPAEIKRDIGTRLFAFRPTAGGGTIDQELNRYHPHGALIVRAFVDGINAYVRQALKTPETLPFEFKVLNTTPGLWTPEIVISRHQGLLSNVRDELNNGRLVHLIGADKVRDLEWFHPRLTPAEPDLTLHVDGQELFQPILELYEAFRLPLKFSRNDKRPGAADEEVFNWFDTEKHYVGSNNWVIDGSKSASGYPMLANDPHRAETTPSLRYWVHLNAPGWNVVGAGEPTLPGVSIGHNDNGAWGLTIFETDNEDLYVYETNPANPNQYKYRDKGGAYRWVPMTIRTETIRVKGDSTVGATLKYTRHGPVVFEDKVHHKAYAVRAGWLEPGCAPYLASLRMNQAKTWTEFRNACRASRIPGENMIWGDTKGNIGWQAVGISPIRKNWTGLVPVPGDGRYEWSGYLPIEQLPSALNSAAGFIATANNNLTRPDFPNRNAIGWSWAGPARAHRIEEVLTNGQRKTMVDMMKLQTDYLSIPARTLVPLLATLSSADSRTEQAMAYLRRWDYQLAPESVAASIYVAWEEQLKAAVYAKTVPVIARKYLRSLPGKRVIDWLVTPDVRLGANPPEARDSLLLSCLTAAVGDLTKRLGTDVDDWSYGQRKNKHITLTNAMSELVDDKQRQKINLGPLPRGGYGETVNATGSALNQTHGASFRILVDTENWDKTLGINSPGQSGNPDSPHYRDLFEMWARNDYFPVYFSKETIRAVGEKTTMLIP